MRVQARIGRRSSQREVRGRAHLPVPTGAPGYGRVPYAGAVGGGRLLPGVGSGAGSVRQD